MGHQSEGNMAASEKELEQQLMEAGNRLLSPPSSVDELLHVLDQIESCLTKVEQSPSESMQKALSPARRALVVDKLLRHSDLDVQVAVAACISEITRITAPDAPYEDDQMKEVFQLIVSSFEKLYDKSSRSYDKRALILETVAKVRSCVVMLDLECDALIVEMFQHFLKSIRDYHPDNVFSSMETIMTLVLEESEDIPLELISSILECLKREDKEVLPVARKLGEKVLENCATKLKPYLEQAVKSIGTPLDAYSKVVGKICPVTPGARHDDGNIVSENLADERNMQKTSSEGLVEVDEGNLQKTSSEGLVEVAKVTPAETAPFEEVPPIIGGSPNAIMSNGTLPKGTYDASLGQDPLKEPDKEDHAESNTAVELCKIGTVDVENIGSVPESQFKPEKTDNQKGGISVSIKGPLGPSESHVDGEKEEEKMPDQHESESKDVGTSLREDSAADAGVPSANEKEASGPGSMPKESEDEAVNVASPSPTGAVPDENRSRKAGRVKKKKNVIEEATPSADTDSKKVSEGISVSESKPVKRVGRKSQADTDESTPAEASKEEDGNASDLDAKSNKPAGRKVEVTRNQQEDRKRRGKGKSISGKDKTRPNDDETSVGGPIKDERQAEKTSKENSKRKRTPGKDKVFNVEEYGEELVGSMIKVWWPDDQKFYDGRVESYDPDDKKHKIVYTDGDVEVLLLRDERWELIEDGLVSNIGDASDGESPDASSEMHKKKKAKTTDSLMKAGKMAKKGGGVSSSGAKATPSKSGRKLKNDGKVDAKSKDASGAEVILEDEKGGKPKGLKGGNTLVDDALKAVGKSKDKDDHPITPKAGSKLKSDTPKNSTKSKGKATKGIGGKSDANGMGKGKTSSSKVKDIEDAKKPPDSAKTSEITKGRLASSLKALKGETNTGKKRSRRS
ncbi:hypothetical protein Ancab_001695 [Ancistrocladus abbreviatus]